MQAISTQKLTKKYQVNQQIQATDLREAIIEYCKVPFRRIISGPAHSSKTKEFLALDEVDIDVKQGEIVGVIGRNGAGKSTLLKVLSRVTHPTSGKAVVRGRLSSLLEVGTGFHPELTGRENVYLNASILGMSRRETINKFDQIVEFSGIEEFLDTPIKRYSSGMKVRLAFAVAAHIDPEILIVDEVLAVGDASFQRKCLDRMDQVASQGKTIMFVSHNMGVLQQLCTRGIVLKNGRVSYDGQVSDAVHHYLQDLESSSDIPLADRADRDGTGDSRLVDIQMLANEQDTEIVYPGDEVEFLFTIDNPMHLIQCVLTVYDSRGQAIASLDSRNPATYDIRSPDSADTIRCRIPELLLKPDQYRVNVALFSESQKLDHVEGAKFFTVENGQVDGRKYSPARRSGSVIMKHHWVLPS